MPLKQEPHAIPLQSHTMQHKFKSSWQEKHPTSTISATSCSSSKELDSMLTPFRGFPMIVIWPDKDCVSRSPGPSLVLSPADVDARRAHCDPVLERICALTVKRPGFICAWWCKFTFRASLSSVSGPLLLGHTNSQASLNPSELTRNNARSELHILRVIHLIAIYEYSIASNCDFMTVNSHEWWYKW